MGRASAGDVSSTIERARAVTRLTSTAAAFLLLACNSPIQPRELGPAPGDPVYAESARATEELGSVPTGEVSPNAQTLRIGCETCHSLRGSTELPATLAELDEFHAGLAMQHGQLSCASCHTPGDVTRLRLADGSAVDAADVLDLCGQCHGPQLRDYRKGAHGGMTGYWDRSRGPRTRNVCTACHDPHSPAYVGGRPVFPPRDRFLDWKESEQR